MNFEKCQLFYWDSLVWCLLSEWLLDGLAGFLTELFIKKFLGNNEARYRRYKVSTFEVFNLVDRLIAYPIVVIAMERCLICWFTIIVYNVFLFYVEVYLIGVLDFEFLLLAWLAWTHASFWFLPYEAHSCIVCMDLGNSYMVVWCVISEHGFFESGYYHLSKQQIL